MGLNICPLAYSTCAGRLQGKFQEIHHLQANVMLHEWFIEDHP